MSQQILQSRPLNGGVSNGGVSRSGLVLPFLSFFVLFGTFPIFPGFFPICSGWSADFPDRPFSLSRLFKSTYEEQSRKGLRHNLDLSRKKWKPPGLASLNSVNFYHTFSDLILQGFSSPKTFTPKVHATSIQPPDFWNRGEVVFHTRARETIQRETRTHTSYSSR